MSSPVNSMLNVNKTFKGFEDRKMGAAEKGHLFVSKLIFCAMNMVRSTITHQGPLTMYTQRRS